MDTVAQDSSRGLFVWEISMGVLKYISPRMFPLQRTESQKEMKSLRPQMESWDI